MNITMGWNYWQLYLIAEKQLFLFSLEVTWGQYQDFGSTCSKDFRRYWRSLTRKKLKTWRKSVRGSSGRQSGQKQFLSLGHNKAAKERMRLNHSCAAGRKTGWFEETKTIRKLPKNKARGYRQHQRKCWPTTAMDCRQGNWTKGSSEQCWPLTSNS